MKDILPKKYNIKLFVNLLVGVLLATSLVFTIAVMLFGYELTSWDAPGSLIAAPLMAHFLYLLVAREEDLEF
jgi:hypothetical protein